MRAGKLDRIGSLLRCIETVDTFGRVSQTWNVVAPLRLEKLDRKSSATDKPAEFGEATRNRITLRTRHVPGILITDRLTVDGVTFAIMELRELGRRDGLEIVCDQVMP